MSLGFDATVVAFCADQSLTIEQRKDKIENFIAVGVL